MGRLGITMFLTLMIIGAIAAFTRDDPRESPRIIETDSLKPVYDNLRVFHKGRTNDLDNDRDFDGDGVNDNYVLGRDGTIYATHSSDRNIPLFKERFYKH